MIELSNSVEKYPILDKIFDVSTFVPLALIWSTFCYSMTFSWYLGGFIMLISPIYGLFVLLYQTIFKKRKLVKPYGYIAIAYSIFIIVIHMVHGDFMFHGIGDIVTLMFFAVLMLETSREEFVDLLKKATTVMLWLTLCYGLLSLVFTYLITSESLAGLNKDFFIYKSVSRWVLDGGSRMVGIGGNSNSTGHWIVYGAILATIRLLLGKTNTMYKVFHCIVLVLALCIAVLTASRAAMLTFGLFLLGIALVYFLFSRKYVDDATRKYVTGLISIAVIALVVIALLFAVSSTFRGSVLSILRVSYEKDMNFKEIVHNTMDSLMRGSGRDVLRDYAMACWKEHKLWGVSTDELVRPFAHIASKTGAHNVFIQVLATTGIFGFILHMSLWILSFFYSVRAAVKTQDKVMKSIALANSVVIVALVVDNLFETYLYTSITIMGFIGFLSFAVGAQLSSQE